MSWGRKAKASPYGRPAARAHVPSLLRCTVQKGSFASLVVFASALYFGFFRYTLCTYITRSTSVHTCPPFRKVGVLAIPPRGTHFSSRLQVKSEISLLTPLSPHAALVPSHHPVPRLEMGGGRRNFPGDYQHLARNPDWEIRFEFLFLSGDRKGL